MRCHSPILRCPASLGCRRGARPQGVVEEAPQERPLVSVDPATHYTALAARAADGRSWISGNSRQEGPVLIWPVAELRRRWDDCPASGRHPARQRRYARRQLASAQLGRGLLEDRGRLRWRPARRCCACSSAWRSISRACSSTGSNYPNSGSSSPLRSSPRRGQAEPLARASGRRQQPPDTIEERGRGRHQLSLPAGIIGHAVAQNACAVSSAERSRGGANRKR